MSLNEPDYDNEHMVGAARRKSKYPRKILRVILSDGTCKLQAALTPDDIQVKDEEDWTYYNHGSEEEFHEVIPDTDNYNIHDDTTYIDDSPSSNILTNHTSNELESHHITNDEHTDHHNNEQNDHALKSLSDLRLSDSRYDVENRYYDSNESPMYNNLENNSNNLSSKFKINDIHPGRPKEGTRPHKHQHPEPTPELPYQCDTCDMLFKTIELLTDHQRSVHHNNRQFACRYCSKRFNDKYNMRKHVLIHVGEKRHRCQFCNKAFLRKDHLRSHLQTHYNRKYGCKICGKSFRTLDMYQRHAKTHKQSPSLTATSDNSNSSFSDMVTYGQNMDNGNTIKTENIQNGGRMTPKGDHDEMTNGENGDSLHISNVTSQYGQELPPHVPKVENFPVTILDEDYNEVWGSSPTLSEDGVSASNSPVSSDHNHTFLNGNGSPSSEGFHCNTCSATFKTDASLQLHSQNCSGEIQNWQCMKCNIIFDEAKTLKQHYEKVHSVEEPIRSPSRWRCKTCNINYPNSKELSRHYAQAHKDAQIFPCSECPKTFTVWHNLKKHMLIHLGDKKHKCTVCEKGFVRKDHLNSHMKVHLGDGSKFTCPICCKVFRLKQMYLKHMNLHGLEQAYDEKAYV